MSKRNGDKARFNRALQKRRINRERSRALRLPASSNTPAQAAAGATEVETPIVTPTETA